MENLHGIARAALDFLWQPLADPEHWTLQFWLAEVVSGRMLVFFFFPVALGLAFVPQRLLRPAIVVSGLAAIGYLFGATYGAFWLILCALLHKLTQQLAIEFRRTDVWRGGPTLAAWFSVVVITIASVQLSAVHLPDEWCRWLMTHTPWMYPYGLRGWAWEADFRRALNVGPESVVQPTIVFSGATLHFFGIAYLVIRMLHYISELARNTIPPQERTLPRFLAYTCYFPLLIHGPIERYAVLQREFDRCQSQRTARDVAIGVGRIGFGLFQAWIAALYFWPTVIAHLRADSPYYANPAEIESYAFLWAGAFISVFGLYLQFGAYCEVSLGMSRILGIRVAENFDRPWFATSLTDLWRRWHITLSFVLRDYIFVPLTRRRWPPKLNLVITFVVCGLWHAPALKFMLWGALMGLMVGVNQSWARRMRTIDQHPGTRLHAVRRAWLKLRPLPTLCAWFATQHAFVYSALYFFGDVWSIRVVWELIRRPAAAIAAWF